MRIQGCITWTVYGVPCNIQTPPNRNQKLGEMYCLSRWRIPSFICDYSESIAWYPSRWNLPKTLSKLPDTDHVAALICSISFPWVTRYICIPTTIFKSSRGPPKTPSRISPFCQAFWCLLARKAVLTGNGTPFSSEYARLGQGSISGIQSHNEICQRVNWR